MWCSTCQQETRASPTRPAVDSFARAASSPCRDETRPTPRGFATKGSRWTSRSSPRPRQPAGRPFAPMTGPQANACARPSANCGGRTQPWRLPQTVSRRIACDLTRRTISSANSITRQCQAGRNDIATRRQHDSAIPPRKAARSSRGYWSSSAYWHWPAVSASSAGRCRQSMRYWNLALGLTLGGQGTLILGLVLVISRLWRTAATRPRNCKTSTRGSASFSTRPKHWPPRAPAAPRPSTPTWSAAPARTCCSRISKARSISWPRAWAARW